MPRYSDDELDDLKRNVDLVALIRSRGIELRPQGQGNLVGLCPFHDDHKPSLRVTGGKGLFRCPACGATGNAIQFVARKEGITDREAALKLCQAIPGVTRGSALQPPISAWGRLQMSPV